MTDYSKYTERKVIALITCKHHNAGTIKLGLKHQFFFFFKLLSLSFILRFWFFLYLILHIFLIKIIFLCSVMSRVPTFIDGRNKYTQRWKRFCKLK